MAGVALLARNADPGEEEIRAALPNLCRCGVYPRLVRAVRRAGRVMRRLETIAAAPVPGISADDAARVVPAIRGEAKQ
jgi:isoquinoline 1-oxidoreductase alpha subunit